MGTVIMEGKSSCLAGEPNNRGLEILTSKEVSYMRELAREARSARDERMRNSRLRRGA